MAGMSRKEIARLLDHVEPQGVTLTRTKSGVLMRMPDGKATAMVHFTSSDVNMRKALRAQLKRAGVSWPTDAGPVRAEITDHKPTRRSLEQVSQALAGWDQRYITGSQLVRLMGGEPDYSKAKESGASRGMTLLAAQRCLYHLGWIPTGPAKARKWLRPLELEPEPVHLLEPEPEPTPEPETVETDTPEPETALAGPERPAGEGLAPVSGHPSWEGVEAAERLQAALGAPQRDEHLAPPLSLVPDAAEVKAHPAGHEYIDTVDSWTGNLEQLPEGMSLAQLRQLLGAFGLQLELRVWRADA